MADHLPPARTHDPTSPSARRDSASGLETSQKSKIPSLSFENSGRSVGKVRHRVDENPRSTSPTWVDVDQDEPRHTRASRSSGRRTSAGSGAPRTAAASRRSSAPDPAGQEKDTGGFFPRLSRILEGKESDQDRRRSGTSNSPREGSAHASRRSRASDEHNISYRRAPRARHSSLQRQFEILANPSLLSVLSSLTNASGTSSGSNSTVTQKSYDKSIITKRRRPKARHKQAVEESEDHRTMPRSTTSRNGPDQSSVFNFMEQRSDVPPLQTKSTSSSGYEPSDGGCSSTAATSVTKSPFSSPGSSYKPMPRESWTHQDKSNSDSGISVRGSSPEPTHKPPSRQSSVRDADEDDDEHHNQNFVLERSSMRMLGSSGPQCEPDKRDEQLLQRMQTQEEEMRQHILQSPQPRRIYRGYTSTPYNAPPSATMPEPDGRYPMHSGYMYPPPYAPQVPTGGSAAMFPEYSNHASQPPFSSHMAPTYGPDLSKTTIVGYEMLASMLSRRSSKGREADDHIEPVYRKFEKLNHRILLHLQDEIAEQEEELRLLDECIAQTLPPDKEGHRRPSSRRTEADYGLEVHRRRTELLGRIFLKLGQYNQALSSYGQMIKSFDAAESEDIRTYQTWMEKHTPIDKAEARFLNHRHDLVAVNHCKQDDNGSHGVQFAVLGLPLILLLPLVAFSVVSGVLSRLFLLVIIGVAGAMAIASNRVFQLMTAREWATCGAAYFAVMAVVASMA